MKKVLIVQFGYFGDCLYATVIARQIKHDFPDSHVTWIVFSKYKSILEGNPYIDKIWEVESGNDARETDKKQKKWMKKALAMQKEGIFDEVIISHINARNIHKYTGTIRHSILQSYEHEITVPIEPVVRLSNKEINEVKEFVRKNNIEDYATVLLFECMPTSSQSKFNFNMALNIAHKITAKNPGVAIIISSSEKINTSNKQLIDASVLSFKHNAELTKYCDLLVGCSSGITWLSTSDWAKKIPMIQILDKEFYLFAGVAYDFYLSGLSDENVIEMFTLSEGKIIDCIELAINDNFKEAKQKYNEENRVSYYNFRIMNFYTLVRMRYINGFKQIFIFKKHHKHLSLLILFCCYLYNCICFPILLHIVRRGPIFFVDKIKKIFRKNQVKMI